EKLLRRVTESGPRVAPARGPPPNLERKDPMETWKFAWRNGIAPSLSTAGLTALRDALRADDRRLIQYSTTFPPPLDPAEGMPVAAACALGFACWKGRNLTTVGEVETAFALVCQEASERLGEPGGVRWFLNWHDETDRAAMRRELLAEVERILTDRARANPAAA